MNDPAPSFGRGGWVCAALLLGLFAGGGITWAIVERRAAKSPLIVYQLPSPEAIAAGAPGMARSGLSPGSESPVAPLDAAGSDTPVPGAEPRLLAPATRDGDTVEPTVLNQESPPDRLSLPALRVDRDRLLHTHPKAEGCLANALAALGPFTKKGFNLRDKVWDGEISLEEGKAVSCQLFKGNDYCFCVGTDARGTKLTLQLYSSNGEPADAEQYSQVLTAGASATAYWHCNQTGTYFVVVKLEAATQEKVPWGMVSAYR